MNEIIYEAYKTKHKKEIISVLNECLEEGIDQRIFDWKHEDNVFGKSLGFIARDEEGIVGCNFFMIYTLMISGKPVKALRSCESAVLPRGRRKGIFSKLISMAHEKVDNNEYSLIFGTPNENSVNGFLKKGWKEIEPIDYNIKPVFFSRKIDLKFGFDNFIENPQIEDEKVSVLKNKDYLKWRFSINTKRDYTIAFPKNSTENTYCIYKIRTIRGFRSLVVLEKTGTSEERNALIKGILAYERVFFLVDLKQSKNFRNSLPVSLKENNYRFIYYQPKVELNKWNLSLGDLEDIL